MVGKREEEKIAAMLETEVSFSESLDGILLMGLRERKWQREG